MKLTLKSIMHNVKRQWQMDVIFWRRHKKKILSISFILFHIIGALSTINAVMHTRTSQGAIAWAVSLNTFPYVAVPAYWVFGASQFDDYIEARRKARDKGNETVKELNNQFEKHGMIAEPVGPIDETLQNLYPTLSFTKGNSGEYLIDGGATYASILKGIDEAKDYILFQFYIIRDDEIGRQFRDALTVKARQGVRVYAMYDEVGSLNLPNSFKKPLTDAGGKFIPFNTTQGFGNRFRINFRNHRKVVIIDGRQAWVGGINIGEEYEGSGGKPNQYLRDTHLKMKGPVVQMIQSVFMEDWYWAARNFPRLNWQPETATTQSMKMMVLPSGPSDKMESCALYYLNAINSAKKRLWISSPYFVPDEQIKSALALAALRGVDVRIMIPKETDSWLIDLSHKGIEGEMEKTGVAIYRYEKGFNHQKVALVDDQYSYVGTANMDNRSFRLNFEITIMIDDKEFASQTEEMLDKDFSNARKVEPDEFRKSSFYKRFLSRSALLLSPVQ